MVAVTRDLLAGVGAAVLLEPRKVATQGLLGTERLRDDAEHVRHRLVLLVRDPVVDPRPVTAAVDNAGRLQDAELARAVRLAEIERLLKVADAQLAVCQECDDADACLVTERTKYLGERPNVFEVGCT